MNGNNVIHYIINLDHPMIPSIYATSNYILERLQNDDFFTFLIVEIYHNHEMISCIEIDRYMYNNISESLRYFNHELMTAASSYLTRTEYMEVLRDLGDDVMSL